MLGAGIQVFDHINGIVGNIPHQSLLGYVERQIFVLDDANNIFRSARNTNPAERKPRRLRIGYLLQYIILPQEKGIWLGLCSDN